MDDKYIEAFNAVKSFVDEMWETFGDPKKITKLALYRRLIDLIKIDDSESVNKVVSGFKKFVYTYEKEILANELDKIERGSKIKYGNSDNVYLEIQKYIYQADLDVRECIRRHLITISAIIDPKKEKIEELEKAIDRLDLDDGTVEGKFISDIMHKTKDSMENIDTSNPMTAITGLLNSGIITDMVAGFGSGNMDLGKLLGTMQTAVNALAPPVQQTSPKIEEITDEVD